MKRRAIILFKSDGKKSVRDAGMVTVIRRNIPYIFDENILNLYTGNNQIRARGSGQEAFEISRVESGPVGSGRLGSARVGSARVGSGQAVFF